ncbi:MAG: helix-turn-helix domain-containing protein [Lachnospiraceae bacterium]|jgi:AraC-like DNA-binding protein|nr:helix-turn-helix domain-containing protein [Lachnospiraceae bacterium]
MSVFYSDSLDFLDKRTKRILAEMRESFVPHTPYQYEKNMLTAVKNGDLAEAEKCTRLLDTTGKGGVMSSDPLQQAQIHLISHITLITRAALEAGVTEDLAYAMSDSYIQIAQGCTSPKQLMQLRDRSVRDFTGAVMHLKNSPPCSKSIRAAINYMHRHLQEKITLDQLAQASGLSSGRFSHLFKEETGVSPMTYLLRIKMETAQTMLSFSDYTLSEISTILGFSSESHFIQAFKRHWGMTPGKFKR